MATGGRDRRRPSDQQSKGDAENVSGVCHQICRIPQIVVDYRVATTRAVFRLIPISKAMPKQPGA
jgi:hypothetical protein